MKFYYTTGSIFEKDEMPHSLGTFTTFHAAESVARQLLISETTGVIYLYVPASSCGIGPLPNELMGWRGRFFLVRILSSLAPRIRGTPFLFGTLNTADELPSRVVKEREYPVDTEQTDSRIDLQVECPVHRDSFLDTQDLRASFSFAL